METIKAVGSVFFVLLCLVLVLVLAYQSIRLLGRRVGSAGSAAGSIKVLDRLPLAQDQTLYIVEAAGKTLLLGATPQGVRLVCELDPSALPKTPPANQGPGQAGSFGELLRGLRAQGARRTDEERGGPMDGGA